MAERTRQFCDPNNPTADELSTWAYDPDASEPNQDWDVVITNIIRVPIFVKFVADSACPKRLFFLSCLYLWIGDLVRSSRIEGDQEEIIRLLDDAAKLPGKVIYDWTVASKKLMAAPSLFQYDDWCAGALARKSLNSSDDCDFRIS